MTEEEAFKELAVEALAGPQVPFFVAAAIAFANGLVAFKRLPETTSLTSLPSAL